MIAFYLCVKKIYLRVCLPACECLRITLCVYVYMCVRARVYLCVCGVYVYMCVCVLMLSHVHKCFIFSDKLDPPFGRGESAFSTHLRTTQHLALHTWQRATGPVKYPLHVIMAHLHSEAIFKQCLLTRSQPRGVWNTSTLKILQKPPEPLPKHNAQQSVVGD